MYLSEVVSIVKQAQPRSFGIAGFCPAHNVDSAAHSICLLVPISPHCVTSEQKFYNESDLGMT